MYKLKRYNNCQRIHRPPPYQSLSLTSSYRYHNKPDCRKNRYTFGDIPFPPRKKRPMDKQNLFAPYKYKPLTPDNFLLYNSRHSLNNSAGYNRTFSRCLIDNIFFRPYPTGYTQTPDKNSHHRHNWYFANKYKSERYKNPKYRYNYCRSA